MNEPTVDAKPRTAIEALSHEVERHHNGIESLKDLVRELAGEDNDAPDTTPFPPVGCFRVALVQASKRLEVANAELEALTSRIRELCLD